MGKNARDIRKNISETVEQLGDTVGALSAKADVGGKIRDTLSDTADNVSQTLRDGTSNVKSSIDAVSTAASNAGDAARSGGVNPYALALAVLGVGVVAGLLVPLSSLERSRLKPIGDDLARRAVDARDEIVGQSTKIVRETVSAAQESAERHGKELADNLGVLAAVDEDGSKSAEAKAS